MMDPKARLPPRFLRTHDAETRRTIESITAPTTGLRSARAGKKRTGEVASEYISLLINDPALPKPIRANLFRDYNDAAVRCTGRVRSSGAAGSIPCAIPSEQRACCTVKVPSLCLRRIWLIPSSRSNAGRPAHAAKVKGDRRAALCANP